MNRDLENLFENSVFYQEFSNIINAMRTKIVSFDIFDTLVLRKCLTPEWVFEEVGRRAISKGILSGIEANDYSKMRSFAERSARKKVVDSEDITFEQIFLDFPYPTEVVKSLKSLELEIEKEVIYSNDYVVWLMRRALASGKRVILISDMYLSKEQVHYVALSHLPDDLVIEKLYISSENLKTKATGSQYHHVLDELSVASDELLHIGDNLNSDVRSAKSCGCHALHYDVPDLLQKTLTIEKAYGVCLDARVENIRRLAAICMPRGLDEKGQFFFLYGAFFLGPALTAFAKWIIARVDNAHIKHVLPLMREGALFAQCLRRELAWHTREDIQVKLCYVSRKSTYLPALDVDRFFSELAQVFERRNFTVGNLLSELQLEVGEEWLIEHEHLLISDVEHVSLGAISFGEVLARYLESNREEIESNARRAHALLADYLSDMIPSTESYATIDFGGGGTIQWQMSQVATQRAQLNLLFYGSDRAYSRGTTTSFASFLPYCDKTMRDINVIARSPEILEVPLVGEQQTTLTYRRTKEGTVAPVQPKREYAQEHLSMVHAFNAGVACFQNLSFVLELPAADFDERCAYAHLLGRLINVPTSVEAKWLGGLTHEENFGSEAQYTILNDLGRSALKKLGLENFWRKTGRNLSAHMRTCPWPQGLIVEQDPDWIPEMLSLKHNSNNSSYIEKLVLMLMDNNVVVLNVYGAGEFFRELEPSLKKVGIDIDEVFDRKAQFGPIEVNGYQIKSPSFISKSRTKKFVVASLAFVDEIRRDIHFSLKDQVTIYSL